MSPELEPDAGDIYGDTIKSMLTSTLMGAFALAIGILEAHGTPEKIKKMCDDLNKEQDEFIFQSSGLGIMRRYKKSPA
ncbi:MAG TPA: hypothetical protein VGN63_19575 [Flavisolibacter sp.]|jgi:hypothetical protein|nr:hypothetical protein [Flavisolibacter sp.]